MVNKKSSFPKENLRVWKTLIVIIIKNGKKGRKRWEESSN